MYPDLSKPKSYEMFLLSKCATCSLNFNEDSPKATKLRILRNDENSVDYQEITNIEVLSFIFGMPAYKFSSNVISNLEDSFRPEDYAELREGQPFKTLSDIPSWFCLALCQSCAPKLADLYSTHKEFANNLALDSFVYKATIDKSTNFNNHIDSYRSNTNTQKSENNTSDVKLENECTTSDNDTYQSDCESSPASPQSPPNLQTDDEDTNLAEERLLVSDDNQNDKAKKTSFPSRWLCKECDIQFASDYAISVHKIEFHDGLRLEICREKVKGPPFCCPLSPCVKKFAKQQGVKYHCLRKHRVKLLASNDNEKPSFCNICRLSFTTTQGLRLHWAKVHADRTEKELDLSLSVDSPEKKKCHRCQIEFKSIKEMQQHGLISHLPKLLLDRLNVVNGTKVCCLQCQLRFEGMKDFKNHCENPDQCAIRQNEDVSDIFDDSTEFAANIVNTTETNSAVEEIKKKSTNNLNCDEVSRNSKDNPLEVHTEVVKGPPFQCPKCSRSYKKLEALKDHCRRVHQLQLPSQRKFQKHNLNIPCYICSTIFSNITGLKNHSRLVHSLSYVCGTCYKAFENECLLNTHMERDNCKFEKIDTSNMNFKLSDKIRKENETRASNKNTSSEKTFSCTYCDQGFTTGAEFEKHVAEIHNKFKCCHCFRNFSSIEFLEMHSKRHTENYPDIRCEFCDKDYASLHHMLIHQRHTHFEEMMLPEIKEECHLCDKWYKWKSHLTMHILKHHSLDKPHKCEKCGKSFAASKLLTLHVKKYHEREKTFKCPHCDMSFLYRGPFNLHVIGHSEERPFSCDQCEKRFKSECAVKRHSIIHELREKKFFCEKCGSGFKRKDHFEIHMAKHADQEKPDVSFDCKICGVKMKHSHSLQTHMKWKHPADNKGKFFCKFCEKKFRDSYRLSRHIKGRHSDGKCPNLKKVNNEKTKSSFKPSLEQERVNMETSSSSVLDLRPPNAEIRPPLDYAAPISHSQPLPAHHDSNVQYPLPILPFVNYNQVNNYSTPYFHL